MTTLESLKNQLEELFLEFPNSHFELDQRNKSAFIISREIEKLENPKLYEENKSHWENYEMRL